jgi:hypothetical protein
MSKKISRIGRAFLIILQGFNVFDSFQLKEKKIYYGLKLTLLLEMISQF